jgi:exodeoxyribonuclease-3
MRIATYNVNGIRSAMSKGLTDWLQASNADVLCLQELKAQPGQFDESEFRNLGYELYMCPAEKKGYSGVGIFSRFKPDRIVEGMGHHCYDCEGRVIRIDFGEVSLLSTYFPSGSSGDERQEFKMQFLNDFQNYIDELKQERPQLIIAGDYNICHRAIDIHNPISNARSSGFLPEERAWMEDFLNKGFTDSFRHLNATPHNYTWWSYRAGARTKNLGWRIDYISLSNNLEAKLNRAVILQEAKHSDHCPVMIDLAL